MSFHNKCVFHSPLLLGSGQVPVIYDGIIMLLNYVKIRDKD